MVSFVWLLKINFPVQMEWVVKLFEAVQTRVAKMFSFSFDSHTVADVSNHWGFDKLAVKHSGFFRYTFPRFKFVFNFVDDKSAKKS